MISVTLADDSLSPDWERLIDSHGDHHAQRWNWRSIISSTFGHTPRYYVARQDQRVVGVLPLFEVKSILFGKALISVPYLNGGGLVVEDPTFAAPLLQAAADDSMQLNAKYLELRHRSPFSTTAQLEHRSHKVAMLLDLSSDPEQVFSGFDKKLRSQIRRPEKAGITVKSETGDSELVADFFTVFSENMRDLGTPTYPKSLFRNTVKVFGERTRTIVAYSGIKPVAAAITIGAGNTVEIPWASSLRSFNHHSPNMSVYWEAIRHAALGGFKYFDFGRSSPDSGTFRFKAQWGAKPLPLHWYYLTNSGSIPDVNPKSKKFAALVSIWQKFPLAIANPLGAFLTRSLP